MQVQRGHQPCPAVAAPLVRPRAVVCAALHAMQNQVQRRKEQQGQPMQVQQEQTGPAAAAPLRPRAADAALHAMTYN